MSDAFAPEQLPLAPKPLPDELFSSWLLRLAATNAISLSELLEGLQAAFPGSLTGVRLLDHSLPDHTLQALSQFARAPVAVLRNLDLARKLPRLNVDSLLRVTSSPRWRTLTLGNSFRYGFCQECLAEQQIAHIRWDWCVAPIVSCVKHRTELLDRCPACGWVEPITFSLAFDSSLRILCRTCGWDLARSSERTISDDDALHFLESAYRAALLGNTPRLNLLGRVATTSFQRFVEDMFQALVHIIPIPGNWSSPSRSSLEFPRSSLVRIIAQLVWNSIPAPDASTRQARFRRCLAIWSKLFMVMPESQGASLEGSSRNWPPTFNKRFTSALYKRRGQRWPYGPYSPEAASQAFRYRTLLSVQLISTQNEPERSKSTI